MRHRLQTYAAPVALSLVAVAGLVPSQARAAEMVIPLTGEVPEGGPDHF